MTVNDQQRLELHRRLEDVLGVGPAATMMAYLPHAGWSELATSADIAVLSQDITSLRRETALRLDAVGQRFDAVDQRFATIDQRFATMDQRFDAVDRRLDAMTRRFDELHREIRTMTLAMIGTIVSVGGLLIAALKL